MLSPQKPLQSGFSLLEVLISIIILAIGLISLGSMHSLIIKSSGASKSKAVAAMLAQEKLDDLRAFEQLASGGNGVFGYNEIWSDPNPCTGNACATGGLENSDGSLIIPYGDTTVGNTTFRRIWTVQNYYFCGAAAAPSTSNTCSAPNPNFKLVTMSIAWQEPGTGEGCTNGVCSQALNLQSTIAAISPASTGQSAATGGRGGPVVQYTPGAAPDIIPIGLGDNTIKEATRPTPDITQHGTSTITTFDEITYNNVYNTKRRDNFFTVNCVCEQNGMPSNAADRGYLPTTFDGTQYVIPSSTSAAKRTGSTYRQGQTNEQPALCDICCRDHHDLAAPSTSNPSSFDSVYDPFRPLTYVDGNGVTQASYHSSGDHKHFFVDNSGNIIEANNTSDRYFESCRMVLVGGSPRVLQDWKLEAHQIMPASYLTANVSTYVNYVTTYITQFLSDSGTSSTSSTYPLSTPNLSSNTTVQTALNPLPTSDTMTATATKQYVGRGLYIDYMSSTLRKKIRCKIDPSLESGCSNTASETYLPFVPFHEVNLTKIAFWTPTTDTIAKVLSTTVTESNETNYNRGLVTAVGPGTQNIVANIAKSNTGLTMSHYLDPDDLNAANDQVAVTVTGTGVTPPGSFTAGGNIAVSNTVGGGVSPADIAISGDCTKTTSGQGNNAAYSYSCTLPSGNGSLIVSGYQKNASNTHSNCIQMSNTPAGTSKTTSGSGTSATTTYTFTGLTSNHTTVNLTVQNGSCT